jgi:hypothetical protein
MRVLRLGDRIRFEDDEHMVTGLAGTSVRLEASDGTSSVVLLTHLLKSSGFQLLGENPSGVPAASLHVQTLSDVPDEAATRARDWERHVVEVMTGLPPGSPPEATPRPEYDPVTTTLMEREAAKAAELTMAGTQTSPRTVQRMRYRYQAEGLRGLVDTRSTRQHRPEGRADQRLVEAIQEALAGETNRSTGTRSRLRRRVEDLLAEKHGAGTVPLPSRATFNRLVATLSTGRHTFGQATTRRSIANRPDGPYTVAWSARPGQQVPIDTTPLDVMAIFDDGQPRRVELTAAVDVATRTICAAVLRPMGTKAVDASLLLARMLVPEPMRPGWTDTLRMSTSWLPHRSLADIDSRMADAAAKPVIVPETIVCDRGKVYLSETFVRSCQTLGISVQPARPYTPTDKGIVERTFHSINTLFSQYVAGYTGRDVTRRARTVEADGLWTMTQLQDLLDEWIIVGWQQRPHEGLISPDTSRTLSPNEMYAALVSATGYVPITLTGEDYIELLPAEWRTINDYGIRMGNRTYDARALNPLRRQNSGVTAQQGRWEVHYDPYDLTQVWVRNHRDSGWIRATWTHLPMVSVPFADFTWRHARQQVIAAGGTPDETTTARALDELLRRAGKGPNTASPPGRVDPDQRIVARTTAATTTHRPEVDPDATTGDEEAVDKVVEDATVIPFGVFDARAEARSWP